MLDDSDDGEEEALGITAGQRKDARRDSRASRSSRLSRTSAGTGVNRRNFGGASDPVGLTPANPTPTAGRRRSNDMTGRATGNSRSRSTARTPPRRNRMGMAKPGDFDGASSVTSDDNESYRDVDEGTGGYGYFDSVEPASAARGRATDSRPLSRSSSPLDSRSDVSVRGNGRGVRGRRTSMAISTRFAGDSSGDEGGDVARGLVGTGGEGMLGMRGGNGMIPGNSQGGVVLGMGVDPAEELMAEDLEVPLDKDGMEIREWPEALRVSEYLSRGIVELC